MQTFRADSRSSLALSLLELLHFPDRGCLASVPESKALPLRENLVHAGSRGKSGLAGKHRGVPGCASPVWDHHLAVPLASPRLV